MPSLDTETTELIHLVIDGEASPAEQQRLHAVFEHSPEARGFFDDLSVLERELSALQVEPPSGLVRDVLRDIRKVSAPRPWLGARIAGRLGRRNAVLLAWAATAAAIAGIALFPLLDSRSGDIPTSQVAATMARPDTGMASWALVARATSTRAPKTGFAVRRSGDEFAIVPQAGDTRSPVSIRWNREKLEFINTLPGHATPSRRDGEVIFPQGSAPETVHLRRRAEATGSAEIAMEISGAEVIRASIATN